MIDLSDLERGTGEITLSGRYEVIGAHLLMSSTSPQSTGELEVILRSSTTEGQCGLIFRGIELPSCLNLAQGPEEIVIVNRQVDARQSRKIGVWASPDEIDRSLILEAESVEAIDDAPDVDLTHLRRGRRELQISSSLQLVEMVYEKAVCTEAASAELRVTLVHTASGRRNRLLFLGVQIADVFALAHGDAVKLVNENAWQWNSERPIGIWVMSGNVPRERVVAAWSVQIKT
jgi:hypothetical protein